MARINLTLDEGTYSEITKHAGRLRIPRARLAKELLSEALARRAAADRRRKLAGDYAAGRRDERALLNDLEVAQLELLDDEEA
jgi:hypothetical protein